MQPLPRLFTDEPFRHEGAKHSRSVSFAPSAWVLNRGWRHFGCCARQVGQGRGITAYERSSCRCLLQMLYRCPVLAVSLPSLIRRVTAATATAART